MCRVGLPYERHGLPNERHTRWANLNLTVLWYRTFIGIGLRWSVLVDDNNERTVNVSYGVRFSVFDSRLLSRKVVCEGSYLVDPASSHMLVSKIKPCMSKYKHLYCETANGSLNQLSFI